VPEAVGQLPTKTAAPSRRAAYWALGVLTAINLLNYLDRYVVAPLATDLKRDMALSDTQLGSLLTAFILVYMVAAPVFKRVAEQVLAYMDVPHDVPTPSDTMTAKNPQPSKGNAPESQEAASAKASFDAAVAKTRGSDPSLSASTTTAFGNAPAREATVTVPDLSGKTVRAVIEACSRLGLSPSLLGDGIALEQFPESGVQVARGARVTVRFGQPGAQLRLCLVSLDAGAHVRYTAFLRPVDG